MVAGLYLGSMGWSYGFWGIYPKDVKPAMYLAEYARRFNSVEINSSFYRVPRASTVESWAAQVPDGFLFSAKFPSSVTHAKGLLYDRGKLEAFLSNISALQEKRGPLLLQFPPTLRPDASERLEELLDTLPTGGTYAAEFRHKDWFTEATYRLLRDRGVALAHVDHPWLPTARERTSDFLYMRFEGDRRSVDGEKGAVQLDRETDLRGWAETIRRQLDSGVKVYGYFSKYFSGYPPSDIETLKHLVSQGG